MSTPPTTPSGARAPEAVRTRLQRAALDLFDEKGYDGTTVDEIAERAGVGRTTFFRAFRSKEDVIFPHHDELLVQVRARLGAASVRHGLVAVSEASSLVLRHYLDEGDLAVRRYHLTRSVPSLRDREVAGMRQYQQAFREHIRTWMSDELRAELMAVSVTTACNAVLRRLLRGQLADPWPAFHHAMNQVLELFAEREDDSAPAVVVVGDIGGSRDPAAIGAAVERALRVRT